MARFLTLVSTLLVLGNAALAADPLPRISAKVVTFSRPSATAAEIAQAFQEQSGLSINLGRIEPAKKFAVKFDKVPFWSALEKFAADTGSRIAVGTTGREIALVPLVEGTRPAPSFVDGPFRVVLKQISIKRDLETGRTSYQLQLEAMWEPRFPVYLIDNEPAISSAIADGKALTVAPSPGRVASSGYVHPLTITLREIPRATKQLDELSGTFTVIAAHQLLPITFDDLTSENAVTRDQAGVAVTLKPVKHVSGRVEFQFAMKYPASHPELESFEEVWAATNRLRVTGPNGRQNFEPTDYNTDSRNNLVYGNYAFAGASGQPSPLPKDLKGWKAVYETPSPLLKQTVQFTLKNIELP